MTMKIRLIEENRKRYNYKEVAIPKTGSIFEVGHCAVCYKVKTTRNKHYCELCGRTDALHTCDSYGLKNN